MAERQRLLDRLFGDPGWLTPTEAQRLENIRDALDQYDAPAVDAALAPLEALATTMEQLGQRMDAALAWVRKQRRLHEE